MKKFLCSLLVLSLFAVSSFADDDKYIVVETDGQGATRLEAINAALLTAIRTAAGQFIDSKTELNNDELNEQIIAYSRGSVAGYDILSEDGSKADEGVYSVKVRVRVEREMIRDSVKTATNKTATVSFRPTDLKPEKEHLDPVTVQSTDAINTTNKGNEAQGAELLRAMLERYNPEDFITFRTVGKVTPVKDKEDFVQVLVEVSFNDKLYNEAFIPDLKQVLGQIAAKKKDITLTKQRDIIRRIRDKKSAPLADSSVIMSGSNLGKDFNLAVFDKPDRFGCTVYQFKKEEADKILNNETGILAQFRSRIAAVKGFEIELTDENDSPIETTEHTIMMPFLLTDNVIRDNVWAFHPTLMQYQGMYSFVPLYIENKQITIPLRFELPEEFQKITRNIKANLLTDEDFSSAWLKTRKGLHSASLNYLTKGAGVSRSLFEEAGEEYPLSLAALQAIEADEILADNNLLLDEVVDRLTPFAEAGNYTAIYAIARKYTSEPWNPYKAMGTSEFQKPEKSKGDAYSEAFFGTQKKSVPYFTRAAAVHPEAMIRMGEIQEQGFYDVKANPKRAKSYFDEGIRILSLLASQGLPSAAAELGHVYIEGLGTKQDIPRATRYFEFARKAGYEHPELWMWEHYGVSMRQVTIPNDLIEDFSYVPYGGYQYLVDAKTCLYLVREKVYSNYIAGEIPLINIRPLSVARIVNEVAMDNKATNDLVFQCLQSNNTIAGNNEKDKLPNQVTTLGDRRANQVFKFKPEKQ